MTKRKELFSTLEAAQILPLSNRTLERYRVTGEGPPYLKVGRKVFYRRTDLDAWLDGRVRRSTSDPGPRNEDADPASATGRNARGKRTASRRTPKTR